MKQQDKFRTSRGLYIIDAAVEYFMSVITAGAFLAALTDTLGIEDYLTGILTSFVSLGGTFSLFSAVLAKRKPIKKKIILVQLFCQIFFVLVFVIPLLKINRTLAIVAFCASLLLGYALYYILYTSKADWYMGLVDKTKTGRFTAVLNNVALTTGMIFSLSMGLVLDYYKGAGKITGFISVFAIIMAFFGVVRVLTVVFSKEKEYDEKETKEESLFTHAKSLLKNKRFISLTVLFSIWSMAIYVTTPFFGTYQNKELGFEYIFSSVLLCLQAIARVGGTFVLGRIADKKSFNTVLNIGSVIFAIALFINMFTVKENGYVFYTAYFLLYGIATGAMSICQVNSIFEVVEPNQRSAAVAIKYSITGLVGFLATIAVSPLVSYIQESGNKFLGMNVYAQQVVSAIGFILTFIMIVYFNFFIKKKKSN